MSHDLVLYDTDGNIGIVTMNRPEKLNAVSHELRTAVSDALIRADDDDYRRYPARGGPGFLCRLRHQQ